jgi:phage terminase Nu1 subunit (DNA packaging protein)
LVAERAKLARSQRERIDMENARRRGEVAPIAKLRDALEDAIAAMVDALDGLPGAIKRRVPALTTEDLAFIADEISRMRDNLADTNIDEEPDDDEGDAPENSSPSEAGS